MADLTWTKDEVVVDSLYSIHKKLKSNFLAKHAVFEGNLTHFIQNLVETKHRIPDKFPAVRNVWHLCLPDGSYIPEEPVGELACLDAEALNIPYSDLDKLGYSRPLPSEENYIPLLWVALTLKGYYVFYGDGYTKPMLNQVKYLVAHRANYDRSTIAFNPNHYWICTYSMAKYVFGGASKQKKTPELDCSLSALSKRLLKIDLNKEVRDKLVAGIGCSDKELDKQPKFVKCKTGETVTAPKGLLSLDQDTVEYCGKDVSCTLLLLDYLWKHHISNFDKFVVGGLLTMSREFVCVSRSYKEWVQKVDKHLNSQLEPVLAFLVGIVKGWKPEEYEELGLSKTQVKSFLKKPGLKSVVASIALGMRVKTVDGWVRLTGRKYTKSNRTALGWSNGDGEWTWLLNPETELPTNTVFIKELQSTIGVNIVSGIKGKSGDKTTSLALAITFWSSYKKRLNKFYDLIKSHTSYNQENHGFGNVMIPSFVNWGTITGRKTESLLAVSGGTKKNKPGSELRTLVVAPDGMKIANLDVKQQEAAITAMIGDAQTASRNLMSSQLSRTILCGAKETGDDIHTLAAKILGVTRQEAKRFNYAAFYGMGEASFITLYQSIRRGLGVQEAKQAFGRFKAFLGHGKDNTSGIGRLSFKTLADMAYSNAPTPLFKTPLSLGVTSVKGGGLFTTKQNRLVQSSGREQLDTMGIYMSLLIEEYGLEGKVYQFYSVHDSISFCFDENIPESTMAGIMTLGYALSWIEVLERLNLTIDYSAEGLHDAMGLLVLDAVEFDYCFRKSPLDCVETVTSGPINPGAVLAVDRDFLLESIADYLLDDEAVF